MKNLLIAAATISFLGSGVIADEFKPDNCSIQMVRFQSSKIYVRRV